MELPVAPIWGFFKAIKNLGPTGLSLDQYFAFLHAIEKLDITRYSYHEDVVYALTKMFWLPDESNEEIFRSLYNQYLNPFEEYFTAEGEEDPSETAAVPGITETAHPMDDQVDEVGVSQDPPTADESEGVPTVENNPLEIELIIKNARLPASESKVGHDIPANRDFMLADERILPFDTRQFVQRLRRKTETTEQVMSDQLDIPEIIIDFTRERFIHQVHYQRESYSASNVVLLSDRFGSMVPYEHLDNQLRKGFSKIPHCKFEHYVFQNTPRYLASGSSYVLKSVESRTAPLLTVDHKWKPSTWFFILSDAGGHSGIVNSSRIRETMRFWFYLQSISSYVFWINPVPVKQLNDCSARRLQNIIPMIFPSADELNALVMHAKPPR